MRTFTKMAAQGDFVIIKIAELPDNIKAVAPEQGQIVVAHSETGHNHVMEASRVQAYELETDLGVDLYEMFLKVEAPTPIEHLRSYHTHESIMVDPGIYRIRRQREYTPEGWRKAAD